MAGKKVLYRDEARHALMQGMRVLVAAVTSTIGPKGRNVVLEKKMGPPQIVNDGVTIAREIELPNLFENTGVSLICQAATKTNDIVGDGTTTATMLAYSIVSEGLKNITSGTNPVSLKYGLEKSLNFLVTQINDYSRPVEDFDSIKQVASISAGNDSEIGELISNALEKVGKDGVISLEEGNLTTVKLEISEGMCFDKGFISPYFVTHPERMQTIFEDSYVLITDRKISVVKQDLLPILEQVAMTKRPLLIIASEIEKEALATLVLNKLRNTVNVAAVRAPYFGSRRKAILEDLAVLSNSQVVTENTGLSLENLSLDQLGRARRVVLTKDSTLLINDNSKKVVQEHCEKLRKQINLSTDTYIQQQLKDRVARLSGGVATLKVGAVTETEIKNKKLRLEDAINATRAAVEEGIVPGGGILLLHLAENLTNWSKLNLIEDELVGAQILINAIKSPFKKIVANAGQSSGRIVHHIEHAPFSIGYNVLSGQIGDMYEFGIVDPTKVTRSALQNAVSIASMILTTECLIAGEDRK